MKILSYPRLHITLADLAGVTLRRFGGAGIAINGLPATVEIERSHHPQLLLSEGLDVATFDDLHAVLKRAQPLSGPVKVSVISAPPQHVGLGSKTALAMAITEGAFRVWNRSSTREEVQRVSGRGGASGVGVHTFFDGGFVVDGGHKKQPDGVPFRPSSAASGYTPPPLLVRLNVPTSWQFTLLVPLGRRYSGRDERTFFETHTPLGSSTTLRSLALVYHGVAAAVACDDIGLMAVALADIHRNGFKRRELRGQPPVVGRLLRLLQERGIPSGMSSMGPLVYAISVDTKSTSMIHEIAADFGVRVLGTFAARNTGHQVIHD